MQLKPKVAFYWCSSCGGCEESIVDLSEDLLDIAQAVDIVLWPVALDFKKNNIESLPDGDIAASFINGAVRLSEQEEWAKLLREKSKIIVAFGACAHLGGVPGLGNFHTREQIFQTTYRGGPSVVNPEGTQPLERCVSDGVELELPAFYDTVKTLDQVVAVDYYLPGCPPPTDLVKEMFQHLLSGTLPPPGAILSPNISLCDSCPLKDSKPEHMEITRFLRVAESTPDPGQCLLAQGYTCMGPATRSGCGASCVKGNIPCRGCLGPMDGVRDQGAAFIAALGSLLPTGGGSDGEGLLSSIPDPAGTFYRYTLPASLLHRSRVGVAP